VFTRSLANNNGPSSRSAFPIVIQAGGKEYFLSSHSELMEGRTFAEILSLLELSTGAILWVERSQGRHWVMGIEADGRLIISPAQGVKFHERERRVALLGVGVWLVVAVFLYFYIRKQDGLDWKLSRKSQWKYPKRPLSGGRKRGGAA
jgi:hypothetical protein